MRVPVVQVDAFTRQPFRGNPAAICVLDAPAPASWMQAVAREMNLSETAFLWPEARNEPRADGAQPGDVRLRWFTPAIEVTLCGHATLAGAHVLWETGMLANEAIARFHTLSGLLTAERRDGLIELDFPEKSVEPADAPAGMLDALGTSATFVGRNELDYLVEVESEDVVRALTPDHARLRSVGARGVIVTSAAHGRSAPLASGAGVEARYDFVSRFFAPGSGIDEDPVTGSSHCALGPYWASKLGKTELRAYQASARGGEIRVRLTGDRVRLGGTAVTVLRGELVVPPDRI